MAQYEDGLAHEEGAQLDGEPCDAWSVVVSLLGGLRRLAICAFEGRHEVVAIEGAGSWEDEGMCVWCIFFISLFCVGDAND